MVSLLHDCIQNKAKSLNHFVFYLILELDYENNEEK